MSRTKVLINILTVLILTVLSGASVWAAPNGQYLITGVVDNIEFVPGVDPDTGDPITIVRVTLHDELGQSQTVDLYLDAAVALGLVKEDEAMQGKTVEIPDPADPTNTISGEVTNISVDQVNATVLVTLLVDGIEQEFSLSLEAAFALQLMTKNEDMIGDTVNINPEDVIPEEGEEAKHPVAWALFEFFAEELGLNYEDIMGYHEEDRMGFGVIAQACWMAFMLNDSDDPDAPKITPDDILKAKRDHDFTSITLPDDIEGTPKNWGQFRKAVLGSEKAHKNLGFIMSGRRAGEEEQEEEEGVVVGSSTELPGKGKGKGGKPGTPPGKEKNKEDEGGGPPAEPPGKVKNKDKGKGGGKKK